jgi:uncharacterized protein YhdP
MIVSRIIKWLFILLSTVCGLILSFSLFLRSDTGRQWAQGEVLDWIQNEYGVSISFKSLEFTDSARGWDFKFHSIAWKFIPGSMPGIQEATGQPIDELDLSINPFRLLLKIQPLTSVRIKGLILRPEIQNHALHLRGAGLTVSRSQLTSWLEGPSSDRDISAWPAVQVEDTRIELGLSEYGPSRIVRELISLKLAGQWSPSRGLSGLQLESTPVDLVKIMEASQRLFPSNDYPALASTLGHIPSFEQGWIENLQIQCRLDFDCSGSANVRHVKWKEKKFVPGLSELSARLDFGPRQLNVTIPHSLRTLTWSALYKKPIPINFSGTRIQIRLEDDAIVLRIPKTQVTWKNVPFEADAALNIPRKDAKKSRVQVALRMPTSRWETVRTVLPDAMLGAGLKEWLTRRIQKAQIKNFTAKLEGLLVEFPFARRQNGHLSLDADVVDLQLAYLDGWPLLKGCRGRFLIRNAAIGMDQIMCESSGLTIHQGKMELPDIGAAKPNLLLAFQVKGSLEAGLQFLQKTPFSAIHALTDVLGIRAVAQKSTVSLQIPLGSGKDSFELQGQTLIPEASWELPREILEGTLRNLALDYDQKGVKELQADMKHGSERAQLTVRRNETGTHLNLNLKPSGKEGLEAALRFTPADQPRRIEGHLSGLVLEKAAARVSVDSLQWEGSKRPFQVKGQAEIQDFGAFWSTAGLGTEFKGGHGTLIFDLELPGNFVIENPGSLTGTLDYDLKDGRIDRLSSTAKALINVANLSIFGVNSGSVTYPFLKGRLGFGHGSLLTENSVIGLGALEIQAKGSVHYPKEFMDLELTIVPDLGSPAASIAIGLWNPLVGLGLYGYSKLHGKASDSRLNRLASQSYRMKGPISKPEISLISILHLKEVLPWTNSSNKTGATP